MNRTATDHPTRARLRSGLPVLGLVLAVSLTACSIEDSPGSWSPPSTPTSGDVAPTTGDGEPTTEAPEGADLTGTWELRTDFLQDAGQATSTGEHPPTLTFEDGSLAVNTGCNTGSGSYEASGDEVTIDPIALTMRACEGQVGALESVVVGLLAAGDLAVGVEDETLTLTAEDGTTLAFDRTEGAGDAAATTSTGGQTSDAPTRTGAGGQTSDAPTRTGAGGQTSDAPTSTSGTTATGATGRATPPASTSTSTATAPPATTTAEPTTTP